MPVSHTVRPLFAAVTTVGIVAAIALLVRPEPVRAEPAAPPPEAAVQVDGVGTATGTPDVLRVTVGVETTADAVGEALQGTDAAARRVLDSLRAEDVAESDVRTVTMSLYPTYADDGQRITGYTARHDLEVTLRDLGRAGEVIGVLPEVGGNAVRLQGVAYALEDDAALQEQARAEAFAAARVKAEQLATLTGRELGNVVEVREQTTPSGPVPFATADAAGGEAMSVALAPGSATVTITVQVHWSLR
jgi:uncharacterized protein YggE